MLAASAGLLIAAQTLTRATGILTLFAILVHGLLSSRRKPLALFVVAAFALVPTVAWSIRSSRLEDRPVLVHSLAGYNFWIGEANDRFGFGTRPDESRQRGVKLVAEKAGIPDEKVHGFWYGRLTPGETANMEERLLIAATERIRDDPEGFALRTARGLLWFWIRGDSLRTTLQYAALVFPAVVLAICGVIAVATRRLPHPSFATLLVLVIAFHNLAYAAIYPMARLSVQVYPCLSFLAGIGAVFIFQRRAGS